MNDPAARAYSRAVALEMPCVDLQDQEGRCAPHSQRLTFIPCQNSVDTVWPSTAIV